jgi:hypothetical protein
MFGAPEDPMHFEAWQADQQQLAYDDAPAPGEEQTNHQLLLANASPICVPTSIVPTSCGLPKLPARSPSTNLPNNASTILMASTAEFLRRGPFQSYVCNQCTSIGTVETNQDTSLQCSFLLHQKLIFWVKGHALVFMKLRG